MIYEDERPTKGFCTYIYITCNIVSFVYENPKLNIHVLIFYIGLLNEYRI